jgi:hypothetical protein
MGRLLSHGLGAWPQKSSNRACVEMTPSGMPLSVQSYHFDATPEENARLHEGGSSNRETHSIRSGDSPFWWVIQAIAAVILVLMFLMLSADARSQTTHYVNGSGVCSGGPCYATITDAVNASSNDDTILVEPGTYNENVVVNKNIHLFSTGGAEVTVIDGDDNGTGNGTFYLTSGRNGVTIGGLGQGFTILGLDNLNPGIEKAAVYLQGAQTNVTIEGNVIEARGDAALMGEWNAANNGIIINANQFTGQTFIGAEPATGNQFSVWNVARQAIVFGGGTSTTNTQNFTFTNNDIATVTGANGVGNVMVTLDLVGNNIIEGNSFSGSSPVYALRIRGNGDYSISGNSFDGDYPVALFRQGAEVDATNNWWGSADFNDVNDLIVGDVLFSPALTDGTDTDLVATGFQPNLASSQNILPVHNVTQELYYAVIQTAIDEANANDVIHVSAGTYDEVLLIDKSLSLFGPNAATSGLADSLRVPEARLLQRINISEDNNVTVSGFEFFEVPATTTWTIYIYGNSNNFTFENNRFINIARGAIRSGDGAQTGNLTVIGNLVDGITTSDRGLSFGGLYGNSVIADNKIDLAFNGTPTGVIGLLTPSANGLTISGNEITNVLTQGLQLSGACGNVVIENNYIHNTNTIEGADRGAIRLYGTDFIGPVTVSGNTLENSFNGIAIRNGEAIDGKDITIANNNLSGNANAAIYNGAATGTLEASCNWFGQASGPQSGQLIGDVDFSPWLLSANLETPDCGGFEGCANPVACNYAGATLDDGSCTFDCYGCTDATPSATQDDGSCGLCYETEEFNTAITIAATQTPGAWYVDRYAPAGFVANALFAGGERLRHIISEFDGGQYRGAQSGGFYDTQGRKYDLPESTNAIEIELYVPADWETTGRRMAGLWGTALNADDAIAAYPIIEFASVDNDPRFRGWGPDGWFDIGLPAGFAYNQWYTLKINLLPTGEFLYTIDGGSAPLLAATNGYAAGNPVGITNVILQGHNTFDGVNYTIHWDNFTYGTTCSEFLGLSWEEVPGSTIPGFTTYRVYADFGFPEDELFSIYGVVDATANDTLSLVTTGSFYRDPAGGLTAASVNPAFYPLLPDLEYHSWLTIGESPQAQYVQVVGINNNDFTENGLVIDNQTGGSLFITPGSSPAAVAGNNPDNRVLIGQFTTDGIVDINLNFQYIGSNGTSRREQQVKLSFPETIEGCTDGSACNFNPQATNDDGTCVFPGCTDALACNYASSAGCDDGSCDYACLTAYYINDDDTDDDVYTTAIGDDGNTGTAAAPFATLTHAISVATPGDTLYIDAGRYAEDVVIDKSVVILGPNYNVNPNTDSRIAEAILHPASTGSYVYQFDVVVSDVTIKGVTLDGDNPDLNSGFTNTTSADIDAASAIESLEAGVNNLVVENNIIRNYFYFAVTLYPFFNGAGTPSSGNSISYNRFEDLGTYDTDYAYPNWGGAVLIHNNGYAKVEHNVITNARIGVQTGNFYQPTPNAAFEHGIRNNEMNTRRLGIFHNLAYSNASEIPVADNLIAPFINDDESGWTGIAASSLSVDASFTGNAIDGAGATTPTIGMSVWNVSNVAPSVIASGSITNIDTGVFLNNFESYSSNGNSGAHAEISAMVIDADEVAIRLYDSPNYTGTAAAEIVASIYNCFIGSGDKGIELEEVRDGAVSATINNNLIDATGSAIDASNIENTVDATCNWFGSGLPSEVALLVTGDVTFVPLLTNNTDDQPGDPGFFPEAGACLLIIEGCTNPSACNYDSDATTDNGTCDYTCIQCDNGAEAGVNATYAPGFCNGCDELENFNAPIAIASTQTPGSWYTDRYAPSVFAGGVNFLSGQRLRQIISEFDGGQYRPAGFSSSFYDTQGRKFDLPENTRQISIELYVPASWETSERRMAGIWGTGFDSGLSIAGYPIIEYASVNDQAGFRTWDGDGSWTHLGLPDDFAYNSWVNLTITLLDNGQFLYQVSNASGNPGTLYHATSAMNGAAETIGNVILQGHNTEDGVSYVIHWDDFNYSHGKLGCTDIAACNYDPQATCDDGSCIDAVAATSFAATLPTPTFAGTGIPNTNFVITEDCNVSASIKAFNRYIGDIVPTGPLYRAESGNSPTSPGDPTPAAGLARWNYYIAVDLGDNTFEDLKVLFDIDWDPTGNSVYTGDLSAFMIANGLGATSVLHDSQNLGFGFWQTIGDPAILPFDPFANGQYDLTLRIETNDGDPILSATMNVEVFTQGCTNPIACNYDAVATDDDGSCDLVTCADCNGVPNGTAFIDDCGVCAGGDTGNTPNESCTDCNNVVNGSAFIDDCGVCAGGDTGNTPDESCTDCNNVVNGSAFIDSCGVCAGGDTGNTPNESCTDCNNVVNGSAFIDDCGVCAGGDTGNTPNASCLDCAGVANGTAFIDDCGVCAGGSTNVPPCVTCQGDFNFDGIVNTSDLTILLANWGCSGANCPGDINNDGNINTSDLGVFLSLFGTICQ